MTKSVLRIAGGSVMIGANCEAAQRRARHGNTKVMLMGIQREIDSLGDPDKPVGQELMKTMLKVAGTMAAVSATADVLDSRADMIQARMNEGRAPRGR